MTRTVVWLGALTAVLTGAGIVLSALGPATYLYPPPGSDITGTSSLWSEAATDGAFVLYALAMAVAASGVVLGSLLRAGGGGTGLLWMSVALLIGGCAATLPGNSTVVTPGSLAAEIPDAVGIGIYLVPAALGGLLTLLAGAATRPEVHRPVWG